MGALLLLLAPFVEVEEVEQADAGSGEVVAMAAATESPSATVAESTPAPTSTPVAPEPTLSPASPPSATSEVTPPETFAEFDESSVLVRIVTKEELGGQAEVHFVDRRAGVDLYDLAIQCVHAELDRGLLSGFCYAFRSIGDFEHAKVNAESGGMENLCWRARFSVAIAGNADGAESNPVYDVSGCPGP